MLIGFNLDNQPGFFTLCFHADKKTNSTWDQTNGRLNLAKHLKV